MGWSSPTTCSGNVDYEGITHPDFTVATQSNRFLMVFKKINRFFFHILEQ